jgi:hypothetical protein
MKRRVFSLKVERTPNQSRYFYMAAWAALGVESCEAPGARCGSTCASNGVMRNRHGRERIFCAAYRFENKLFRHGAGWSNDDSVARNRAGVGDGQCGWKTPSKCRRFSRSGKPWRGGAVAVARPAARRIGLSVRYPALWGHSIRTHRRSWTEVQNPSPLLLVANGTRHLPIATGGHFGVVQLG